LITDCDYDELLKGRSLRSYSNHQSLTWYFISLLQAMLSRVVI